MSHISHDCLCTWPVVLAVSACAWRHESHISHGCSCAWPVVLAVSACACAWRHDEAHESWLPLRMEARGALVMIVPSHGGMRRIGDGHLWRMDGTRRMST